MNILKKIFSLLIGLSLAIAVWGCDQINNIDSSTAQADNENQIVAVAQIKGAPDSNLSGTVTLIEKQSPDILPTVEVQAEINGLPPNTKHGFHIHQTAECEPDFGAAGGHFDPGPFGETNPDANHPFHMGDLPNLVANAEGKAILTHRTSRVTLSSGPLNLFDEDGSAFIVHVDEDQGTTGVKGGAGGGRLGCGIIEKQA
ncbi:MAG: superoxide dismutase family protein [Cyanobacteriota bacterium]|nr:superoxide dismutase family protein [Cyanobacteriota bacterium]